MAFDYKNNCVLTELFCSTESSVNFNSDYNWPILLSFVVILDFKLDLVERFEHMDTLEILLFWSSTDYVINLYRVYFRRNECQELFALNYWFILEVLCILFAFFFQLDVLWDAMSILTSDVNGKRGGGEAIAWRTKRAPKWRLD